MPIRARFLEPQPHVNVVHDKGFVYVFINIGVQGVQMR